MSGTTVTATTSLPALPASYDTSVIGDFDGDGIADVFLRDAASGGNRLLLSDDGFSPPATLANLATAFKARAASDVNGDGNDDLFWFNTNSANITVYAMNGSSAIGVGTFASVYATDDLLHATFNGTALDTFDSLWFDTSANQYDITSYDSGTRTVTDSFTVQAGNQYINSLDYNGDGDLDFLFRDPGGSDVGSIEIVFSNGTNETARLVYEAPTFQGFGFETGGDFDGDGIAEVIMRDHIGGGTSLYNVVGGTTASQTLVGSAGNDLIDGNEGDDRIFGRADDDVLLGRDEDDTIFGGDGADRIDGGLDGDSLWGGAGNDEIQGQSGDDLLVGGAGDDILRAGSGTDVVYGDAGDNFLLGGASGFDHMKGGTGNDVLQAGNDSSLLEGDSGDDQLLGGGSLDHLFGGSGNDYLLGGLSLDTLDGGSGNDILIGVDVAGTSNTDDTLTGGSGDDFFYLGSDATNYYTGSSEAYITDFSASADYVVLNGTAGNYSFVDTGSDVEIRQSSDANVIAVVENVATTAEVSSRAIYIGWRPRYPPGAVGATASAVARPPPVRPAAPLPRGAVPAHRANGEPKPRFTTGTSFIPLNPKRSSVGFAWIAAHGWGNIAAGHPPRGRHGHRGSERALPRSHRRPPTRADAHQR